MNITLIIHMIIAALVGRLIISIIGAAPGADETATIAPITLVLSIWIEWDGGIILLYFCYSSL